MKARFILLQFWAFLCAQAEPEFVGLLKTKTSGTQFILTVEPGTPPQWTTIGQTVNGYLVSEFKEKDETLLLRKDGRTFALKLKESKVQWIDSRSQPMPLAAAKLLITTREGWDSAEISFSIFRDKDGNWCLAAIKKVEDAIAFTFQVLTPESVPLESLEIIERDRPNKAPEPTPGSVTPRASSGP